MVLQTICPGWLRTARITGVSHWHPARASCCNNRILLEQQGGFLVLHDMLFGIKNKASYQSAKAWTQSSKGRAARRPVGVQGQTEAVRET
jgi:hypothetical protein